MRPPPKASWKASRTKAPYVSPRAQGAQTRPYDGAILRSVVSAASIAVRLDCDKRLGVALGDGDGDAERPTLGDAVRLSVIDRVREGDGDVDTVGVGNIDGDSEGVGEDDVDGVTVRDSDGGGQVTGPAVMTRTKLLLTSDTTTLPSPAEVRMSSALNCAFVPTPSKLPSIPPPARVTTAPVADETEAMRERYPQPSLSHVYCQNEAYITSPSPTAIELMYPTLLATVVTAPVDTTIARRFILLKSAT